MNSLIRVIGKAPSELLPEEFRTRLLVERQRIIQEIASFKARLPSSKKAKKAKPKNAIEKALKETGMTIEELKNLLKEVKSG